MVAGEPALPATSAGVLKMPAPITMPTVIIVTSKTPSTGAGSRTGDCSDSAQRPVLQVMEMPSLLPWSKVVRALGTVFR